MYATRTLLLVILHRGELLRHLPQTQASHAALECGCPRLDSAAIQAQQHAGRLVTPRRYLLHSLAMVCLKQRVCTNPLPGKMQRRLWHKQHVRMHPDSTTHTTHTHPAPAAWQGTHLSMRYNLGAASCHQKQSFQVRSRQLTGARGGCVFSVHAGGTQQETSSVGSHRAQLTSIVREGVGHIPGRCRREVPAA